MATYNNIKHIVIGNNTYSIGFPVTSVNSKTGAVSLTASDVGAATSGHTHTTSIATSTGTNQITLAHGSKYALTAGGTSYVFTMPSDNNTDTKVTQAYSTTSGAYPLLMSATSGISSTSSRGDNTAILNNGLYYNPSSETLSATEIAVDNLSAKDALMERSTAIDSVDIGTTNTAFNAAGNSSPSQFMNSYLGYPENCPSIVSAIPDSEESGCAVANINTGQSEVYLYYYDIASDAAQYVSVGPGGVYVETNDVDGDQRITLAGPTYIDDLRTICSYSEVGGVKPWYSHTKASTGPSTGSNNTAVAVNTITSTAGKYYAVESDSVGRLFVNVPWSQGTIPTITLNGSSTTSPSFYAPTSAGTSGYYLKSNGSGAPIWTAFPSIPSGNILYGTSAPSSSTGANGDIYCVYTS